MIYILLFPLLILATAFEIIKRVIGLFIYPVAYLCRGLCRTEKRSFIFKFLWLFLDDSIVKDSLNRASLYLDYCCYGKREPLGFITERMKDGPFKEFLRSYSWGCLRNNAINLAIVLENYVGPMQSVLKHYGNKSFYEVRRFKSLALPYLELWLGRYRLQAGWLKCGRFQAQFKYV